MTLRMAILSPTVIFKARVAQASFSYPIATVTFDTVTVGAYTDLEPGQTVIFGTSEGSDDLGRQRVRGATSTVLSFGRSSQGGHDGEVNLEDNAYIEVWSDHRVWAKIPYIDPDTGEVFKDWDIQYSDQTDESPPVANAGPDMAGTIDSGTGKLRAELPPVANTSFPTADGVAVTGFNWVLPSGVSLVAGYNLTDQVIRVDCDPGWHHVRHTVTDANGKTHSARVKIFARDPDDDDSISDFQIDAHRITQSGQTMSVRVLADIPASTYPDGTAVIIWEGEPSGPDDRSHILFTGWHHSDPARILAERTGIIKEVTLELLDVCGKLATLPGFDQTIEQSDAPDSWLKMKDTNLDKYYHYLLHWHSSALAVADFTWSNQGSLYPFVVLGSPESNLFEQVQKRAQSFVPNHVFVCNRKGQMAIKPDPMVTQAADRTTTIQATLTAADFSTIDYTHQRSPRYHWLREEAIKTSHTAISALFSVAPGDAPGQGASPVPHGEQLARSQDDLNQCAGHRYARLNAPQSPFTIGLVSGKGGIDLGIDPAAMTWVKLTITAAVAAQRGLTFTEARGLPLEVNITYQYERTGLARTTTMLWERETVGDTAGVTYTLPEAPPPSEVEPPPYDPDPPGNGGGDGFGTCYVVVDAGIGRTRDLSASSPSWSDISPTDANAHKDFVLDSWRPLTHGFLTSASGVWKSTDLDQVSPTWNLVLTAAQINTALSSTAVSEVNHILTSINVDGYVAVFFLATISGVDQLYCGYSSDGGSSWNFGHIFTAPGGNVSFRGAADYVPHLVSGQVRLYVGASYGSTSAVAKVFRSDDGGANWSTLTDPWSSLSGHFPNPACIHVPFTNNPSGDTVYLGIVGNAGQGLYKSTNAGSSWSRLITTQTGVHRFGVETWTQDDDMGFFWANDTLLTTDDAFTSTDTATGTNFNGSIRASGGFPYVDDQFYALTTTRILVSTDRGESWVNKTGDWSMGFTNPRVIVPVWVAE